MNGTAYQESIASILRDAFGGERCWRKALNCRKRAGMISFWEIIDDGSEFRANALR